jgi:hypothetical protein
VLWYQIGALIVAFAIAGLLFWRSEAAARGKLSPNSVLICVPTVLGTPKPSDWSASAASSKA